MNTPAKIIQVFIGDEAFSFTVGINDIVSIDVGKAERDFIEFSVLFKEPEPTWRHFSVSGQYLVEWT